VVLTVSKEAVGVSARTEQLIYAAALFSLSSEVLMGLAVPLLAVERGLTPNTLGILLAIATVGPVLIALPSGALCDYFGDRKVLLAMTAGIAVTAFAYPFTASLVGLFVLQFFGGIFRSNAWVALQAYLVRVTAGEQQQRVAGKFSFFVNIGLLVSPVIGGAIYSAWGATAAFGFIGLWGFAHLIIAFLLPEGPGSSHMPQAVKHSTWQICMNAYRAALPIFKRAMLVIMLALTLARLMSGGIVASFYPVYLHGIGFTAAIIGLLMTLSNGGATVGSLVADALARRIGLVQAMIWSIAASAVAIALVPLFQNIWLIAVLSLIHGFMLGISLPLLLTGIAQNSETHERGLILGLRSMFNKGGVMAAPLLMGFLVAGWGMVPGFLITGAVILIVLLLIGLVTSRLQHA
jgi:MFS transporter, DHA1 family, multidrug resistance protein